MAYQEYPTVASPQLVISQIVTFASSNGWAVERNDLAGSNRVATLRKTGVTDYIHIYNTDSTSVRMRISVGYDGGLAPNLQPNVSGEKICLLGEGPYPNLFFFASQDQVWVVAAIAASGEYAHMTFGRLDKAGVYTGGTYVDGTYWPTLSWPATFSFKNWPFQGYSASSGSYGRIRADVPDDDRENWFFDICSNSGTSIAFGETGETNSTATAAALVNLADVNAFSGRSIMHVIPIYVYRTGTETNYSLIGTVQDVRYCSINKFEPEQEITIGADVWKVFPVAAKRPLTGASPAGPAGSGDYGFAIKKVV